MKRPILFVLLTGLTLLAASQQLSLIKDINPGAGGSNVSFLTHVNNTLFFAANNGINGMELWKSNGTEPGTVLVKDINTGVANSGIGYLADVNGILFFVANNGVNGTELWKSDGTDAGTVLVKDIRPGSMGSSVSGLVNVNGVLFFAANDGIAGTELWKSDGTAAGTVMVKDINPLSGSAYPGSIAAVNDVLFFAADNGLDGSELWKSDGTAAGTVMVKDIWPGTTGGYPSSLINAGGVIFFTASDGSNGIELWKSDGTAAGTVMVKDMWPGSGDSNPFGLKSIGGELFFSADNGINGSELWKSDGTSAGTILVKDVWPGSESGAVGNFSKLINQLIFTGNDGVNGYKTWQSDGSQAGTTVATVIADTISGSVQELAETNTAIFASVLQTATGKELWGAAFSVILPVKMLEFTGKLLHDDGILNWKTDQEINTSSFTIERKIHGNDFIVAGQVSAAYSPGIHRYTFTDRNIASLGTDIVYYRLKQTDTYGRISYSATVAILVRKENDIVSLYPNPAINDLNLLLNSESAQKIKYRLVNTIGKIIQQREIQLLPGGANVLINTSGLAAGVYYISLSGKSIKRNLSFIKQ